MPHPELILGIESSCDDTAAAIVAGDRTILSSVVVGQTELHQAFGGVVPEIAARAHAEKLDVAIETALVQANASLSDLSAIGVTAGPGLIGGVLSGVMMARGIVAAAQKPLIGINHLAGHALTPRLTDDLPFPYLILLASGGHCQFLVVEGPNTFERLGSTIDDAPGEAFDKVARILGLDQPGGPIVEREATTGDPKRFKFPRPLLNREGCDVSFSGLKTAVLRARDALVKEKGGITKEDRADICAGFQAAVVDVLAEKTKRALGIFDAKFDAPANLAVVGGVAANLEIRAALEDIAEQASVDFVAPPIALCTDNAAMIAWAGVELIRIGNFGPDPLVPRPRWPLDPRPPALIGSGKKGAKA